MTADHYQVVTTTSSESEAVTLANGVVAGRLGACVHIIGPMTSVYRWEGTVAKDQEWRLVVKTAADRLDTLVSYLKANHSYDLPQIVATEIVGGSEEYLAWVTDQTRP